MTPTDLAAVKAKAEAVIAVEPGGELSRLIDVLKLGDFGRWHNAGVHSHITPSMDPYFGGLTLERMRDQILALQADIPALLAELDRVTRERDSATEWTKEQHAAADRYAERVLAAESRVAQLEAELAEAREALQKLNMWFEKSGSAISARWERVPPANRAEIVKAARAALTKGDHRG